jgi:hypothetical protein
MVIDDSSVDESLKEQENHDWTYNRFKILGDIRQKSIQFAIAEGADYFIADADNICIPNTIKALRATNLPVVSPLLRHVDPSSMYSNFHSSIDENGYFKSDDIYNSLLYQQTKGLVEVPVVHCTYYINNEALPYVIYDDGSGRYEYVIFSDSLRKSNIPQYLDTRKIYGKISFSTNAQEIAHDYTNAEFRELDEYITKSLYTNGI